MKTTLSLVLLLAAATASAKELKLTVTGLRSAEGKVLIAATGDTAPRYTMVAPENGQAVVEWSGIAADELTINVFQDENGNFRLDRRDGKPAEGCYHGIVALPDEKNEATVALHYFFEPASDTETPANDAAEQ